MLSPPLCLAIFTDSLKSRNTSDLPEFHGAKLDLLFKIG